MPLLAVLWLAVPLLAVLWSALEQWSGVRWVPPAVAVLARHLARVWAAVSVPQWLAPLSEHQKVGPSAAQLEEP